MAKDKEKYYGHAGKKVWLGCIVFLVGLLWYLQDAGYIAYAYLWPMVVMVLGVLLVIKGIIKAFMK